MRYVRGVLRFFLTICYLFYVYLLAVLVRPVAGPEKKRRIIRAHAAFLLTLLGLKFSIEGKLKEEGTLLVSNHVSFVDIALLEAAHPGRFIAKQEIASWPLFGTISKGVGTLFINREKARTILAVNRAISEALTRLETVFVFAEGKTGNGTSLLPVRSNLLQPAIDTRRPVQPVAICYMYEDALTDRASYCDRNIFACLWEIVTTPGLSAVVKILPAIEPLPEDRHALAKSISKAVSAAMGVEDPLANRPD